MRTNRSRNSSTPKFVIALPKNTGVTSPRSIAARSNAAPAPSSSSMPSRNSRYVPSSTSARMRLVVHAGNRHRRAFRAVLGAFERVQLVRLAIVHAAERLAVAERPVHRIGADAEHVLELVEQFERIARRPVHLVDEREERNAARAADRKQLAGLRFYALGRIDQHDRAVGRQQRAVRVLAEILMARRIEEIDRPCP